MLHRQVEFLIVSSETTETRSGASSHPAHIHDCPSNIVATLPWVSGAAALPRPTCYTPFVERKPVSLDDRQGPGIQDTCPDAIHLQKHQPHQAGTPKPGVKSAGSGMRRLKKLSQRSKIRATSWIDRPSSCARTSSPGGLLPTK